MRRTTITAKLTRCVTGPGLDGPTLHFTFLTSRGGRTTSVLVQKEFVPAFAGHEAWFELEKVPGKPWARWHALRQVDPPS